MGFTFPFGRAPRIDRSHPVIRRLGKPRITDNMEGGVVAIPLPGSGMVNLVSGQGCTITGTVAFSPHATLGVAAGDFLPGDGLATFSSGAADFAGKPIIMAAITIPKSVSNGWYSQPFIANGNKWFSVNEAGMGGSAAALSHTVDGVTVLSSTIKITANEPWFVLASGQKGDSSGFWLARNLINGRLLVDTTTNNIPSNQDGTTQTIGIGNRAGTRGNAYEGWIGPVCWVPNSWLTLAEAMRWSDDPWSLWYARPPRPITVGVAGGGPAQDLGPPWFTKTAAIAKITQS
jgi:hypothetical protein